MMRPSEQNLKEGLLEDTGESFQAEAPSPGDGNKHPGIPYSFLYLIVILNIFTIIKLINVLETLLSFEMSPYGKY